MSRENIYVVHRFVKLVERFKQFSFPFCISQIQHIVAAYFFGQIRLKKQIKYIYFSTFLVKSISLCIHTISSKKVQF